MAKKTKMNFTMSTELVDKFLTSIPVGQRSAFVEKVLKLELERCEVESLRKELVEGYKARAGEPAWE